MISQPDQDISCMYHVRMLEERANGYAGYKIQDIILVHTW
jgi:hypothetical protein